MLPDCDLDSGQVTKAAEYSLTDDTYAKLLARLSDRKFDLTSPALRANLLDFYSDLSVSIATKTNQEGVAEPIDRPGSPKGDDSCYGGCARIKTGTDASQHGHIVTEMS